MAGRVEEAEQARFIVWTHKRAVRALMPDLKYIHHSPNGGMRNAFTGAQMKALGTKAGFPDLMMPSRQGHCPGLVMEFKRDDPKSTTTEDQDSWLEHFLAQGWAVAVVRSAEEARNCTLSFFGLETAPPM